MFIPVPKAHVVTWTIAGLEVAVMEQRLNRAGQRRVLKQVDRCGAGALESLLHYMHEKSETISKGTDWDTLDPYLRGFRQGLRSGFAAAADLVEMAFDNAWIGEMLMTDREQMRISRDVAEIAGVELRRRKQRT